MKTYEFVKVGPTVFALTKCERCGIDWKFPSNYLSRESYDVTLCKDCKQKPLGRVYKNNDYCEPWHGLFDDDDNPIKDGELYKPGVRSCGHRDCVRAGHIIS
jgi:hypothetical protein